MSPTAVMGQGDIEGNWYQKQMEGLNLLVVKTFPEMRRAGRLPRENFFSSSSLFPLSNGVPVSGKAGKAYCDYMMTHY